MFPRMARPISTTVQGTPKCIRKGAGNTLQSTVRYTVALSCGDRKSPDFLVPLVARAEGKNGLVVDYENSLPMMSTTTYSW